MNRGHSTIDEAWRDAHNSELADKLGYVFNAEDVRDEQTLRERLEVMVQMAIEFSSSEGKGTDTAYCNRCGVREYLEESPRNKIGVSMDHSLWCPIGKAQVYLRK